MTPMAFKDYSIQKYVKALAADFPTPGGGTTAALQAALGASFIIMVARITMAKKSFLHIKDNLQGLIAEAEILQKEFLKLMDRDTAAYNKILDVKAMPCSTCDEKTESEKLMQTALIDCVKLPLQLLNGIDSALHLAEGLSAQYYLPTASDLALSVSSLQTAACGAYLTININLKNITDNSFVVKYKNDSDYLLSKITKITNKIYKESQTIICGK